MFASTTEDTLNCSVFEGASAVNFAFSILITFGIIISYIPQYRRIYLKRTSEDSIKQDKHEYARIEVVGKIVMLHGVVSLVELLIGFNSSSTVLYSIANINGLISAALTVVKYVPQINTTYHLKHPGTLSIGMMCIQTPGGFVFAATLMFTKGSHWSSWVSYLVAALLQGTLLTLCIYYEYFNGKAPNGLTGVPASDELEREAVDRIIEENTTAAGSQSAREDSPLL
ncbi:hypothetical protein PVL30_001300 [Lodderomyces elongisporus]|uniref:uncharacterized protein n=1 Tax=Lodderomyces elongisporus TaxID=36914 RepID=UPI00292162FB|nr:uncharacterized protein PVL30_001300 [Lodderomyces elongisporus]WLF77584.1 hypothetical protein PVL30_001300 [Lodderomyces elongisporus]